MNPQDFEPPDLVDVPVEYTNEPQLRQEASDALVAMFDAALDEAGLELASNSAYRSYSVAGERLRRRRRSPPPDPGSASTRPASRSTSARCRGSARSTCASPTRPRASGCATTPARFGFILRYPADKTDITGYTFEPWHFRYVGTDLANEMRETGVTTLEEFFGLPPAPDYG